MDLYAYHREDFTVPLGCAHKISEGNYQPFFHWHPHYEITFVRKGEYTLDNGATTISLDRPALFVHRPFSLHRMNVDAKTLYDRNIIFMAKSVMSQFRNFASDYQEIIDSSLVSAFPNAGEFDEIVWLCDKLLEAVGNGYRLPEKYNLNKGALLAVQIFCVINDILKDGRGECYSTGFSYMQDVLQYVTENLNEPKTINELADKYGIGHSKFTDDFKKVTGRTYKQYLTYLRMTRAGELLRSGSEIINAALETGYSSEAHFISAFRKYWGSTPGEWKKGGHD